MGFKWKRCGSRLKSLAERENSVKWCVHTSSNKKLWGHV
jgi:hypothetical protein